MAKIWAAITDLVERYALSGTARLSGRDRAKRYAFSILCLIGTSAALVYTIFFMIYDFEGLRVAWITTLMLGFVIFVPQLARLDLTIALAVGTVILSAAFAILTYHLGGATHLYLFMSVGVLCGFLANGKDKLGVTVALSTLAVGVMVVCAIVIDEPSGVARVDPLLQQIAFLNMVIAVPVMIGIGVYVLSLRVARAEAALAAEHARSEALLQNLLPTDIAMRLKSDPGQIIADDLAEVSILFADIVDFTPRASSMPPEKVITFLNRIFTAFDALTDEMGLEKIKTIGDAYMVAAGMPKPREDHAEAIADMALAMLGLTERMTDEADQAIEVRIGIHTGSAIAGVIGTQKVFYDVWGDTVNTASRMESHGVAGRIQLTEDMKARLGDAYLYEPRGLVEIKGKGEIETYWLVGKRGD